MDVLGGIKFRNETTAAYKGAVKRIISVSDRWDIDPDWWSQVDPPALSNCIIYQNLLDALISQYRASSKSDDLQDSLNIVFAGNVPWPVQDTVVTSSKIGFDHYQFRDFLGVIWHLVLTHHIRVDFRGFLQGENKIGYDNCLFMPQDLIIPFTVKVATAPIAATIVDDKVWARYTGNNRSEEIYGGSGICLNQSPDQDLADTYDELLRRYLRHARSAREYVQTVLLLAMDYVDELDEDNKINQVNEPGNKNEILINDILNNNIDIKDKFNLLLKRLGSDNWAAQEVMICKTDRDNSLKVESEEKLKEHAYFLVNAFYDTLWNAGHYRYLMKKLNLTKDDITFGHMVEDVF